MTWLFSLPGKIAMVAFAIGLAYTAGQWQGRTAANANAEARGAKATIEAMRERGLINETVSSMDDCALLLDLNPDSVCDDGQP